MLNIESLRFQIGGYYATNCEVMLEGQIAQLDRYDHQPNQGPPEEIQISEDRLHQLAGVLEELGVVRWKREYYAMVHDGIQWELELTFNGRRKRKIYGSNAYPSGKNGVVESDEESEEFVQFLQALESCVGRPGFFE